MTVCHVCKRRTPNLCGRCKKCNYCHTAAERVECRRKYFRDYQRVRLKIPNERWKIKRR